MLSSTNFWMCFAGLFYLVAGVFILRKEISAARGWDKLITLGCVFIAVPLAIFAPEHFRGPEFVGEYGPVLHAGALVLAVFCRMRAARRSNQSYVQEVRTPVIHPARTDVLSLCLHDLCAYALGIPASRFAWTMRSEIFLFAQAHGASPRCTVAPRRRNYRNG